MPGAIKIMGHPEMPGEDSHVAARVLNPTYLVWNEESFLVVVQRRHGSQDVAVCRSLFAWCRAHVDAIEGGCGAEEAAMMAVILTRGVRQLPFTALTNPHIGAVQINFEYLKRRPPFGVEDARREFLAKLNEIPGIHVSSEKLDKRPSIPYETLRDDDSREQLPCVMQWAVARIRSAS